MLPFSDKSDVMEWMITYQDVRRNMCDAEKIFANDKVSARRIIEENEKRKSIAVSKANRNRNSNCVQMDASENDDKPRDRSANTREQRAKLTGVSTGTIQRYDTVMKSDNEELKQSMLSGDVKIGTEITNSVKSWCVQMDTGRDEDKLCDRRCVQMGASINDDKTRDRSVHLDGTINNDKFCERSSDTREQKEIRGFFLR